MEASQCYVRGQIGFKSKELKSLQAGNSPQVIAYADKANERLRRRYYKMVLGKSKKHNVAKTAIAREPAWKFLLLIPVTDKLPKSYGSFPVSMLQYLQSFNPEETSWNRNTNA